MGVIKGYTGSLDYKPYNYLYNPSFHFVFHFFPFDSPLLRGMWALSVGIPFRDSEEVMILICSRM